MCNFVVDRTFVAHVGPLEFGRITSTSQVCFARRLQSRARQRADNFVSLRFPGLLSIFAWLCLALLGIVIIFTSRKGIANVFGKLYAEDQLGEEV